MHMVQIMCVLYVHSIGSGVRGARAPGRQGRGVVLVPVSVRPARERVWRKRRGKRTYIVLCFVGEEDSEGTNFIHDLSTCKCN